ncbi:hypothetical protein V8F20_005533 [Naviculisporaceae sp. PSN 640]
MDGERALGISLDSAPSPTGRWTAQTWVVQLLLSPFLVYSSAFLGYGSSTYIVCRSRLAAQYGRPGISRFLVCHNTPHIPVSFIYDRFSKAGLFLGTLTTLGWMGCYLGAELGEVQLVAVLCKWVKIAEILKASISVMDGYEVLCH